AVAEHLDQLVALADEPGFAEHVRRDVLFAEIRQRLQVHDGVLDAEDGGEAASGRLQSRAACASRSASAGPCARGWRSCPCPSPCRGPRACAFPMRPWGRELWIDS